MRSLEQLTIDVLYEFKISAKRVEGLRGVWVGDENIAAQGVRLTKWITKHGFSININNNLENYKKIIPCGISDKGITNLKNIIDQDYSRLSDKLIEKFILN